MKRRRWGREFLMVLIGVFLCFVVYGWSEEKKAEKREGRDFTILSECNRVVVGMDKKEWEFDIKVQNLGDKEEEILLKVEAPSGWKAGLYKKWDGFLVKGVKLGKEEGNNSVLLALKIKAPDKGIKEGVDYLFRISGSTKDEAITRTLDFVLSFEKGLKPSEAKGLSLKAEYPSVRGAAGDKFEFVIEVKNDTDKPKVFELLTEAPSGWAAYCTPRWEEEKKISAIKVDAKSSEWIKVFLVPPPAVSTGEYPARLIAKSETDQVSIDLKAVITGTYQLRLGSEAEVLGTGESRNVKAIAGREKHYTLYVWNEGSAPITDVNFYVTQKPKDWEISFEPKKIPSLNPLTPKAPEFQKIDVKIKPKEKAIPGDYVVTISAMGKEAKAEMELRVTVGKPTIWGWIGIGIVMGVIAVLVLVFVKLGRR
jgi:uncharacterized membrane protein